MKGASGALPVDGKMYTEGQLKTMLESPVRYSNGFSVDADTNFYILLEYGLILPALLIC